MNKKLQKQIKAYAGVAGVFLTADKASGQVLYTDITPDTLVNADPANSGVHHFFLDINNDASNDFEFQVAYDLTPSYSYGRITVVSPLNSLQVGNILTYNYWSGWVPFPAPLTPGDSINGINTWLNDPDQCLIGFWTVSPQPSPLDYSGACGVWGFVTDRCLPFRIVQGSDNYYGWLRIEIINRSTFLLKEFAYQIQPNVPMLACDTTNLATGISGTISQFTFSQHNHSIHISTFQKLNHANISVYDLLGKEILKQPFERKETTVTIDKKGIYFVEVTGEKGIFRKKVFIY